MDDDTRRDKGHDERGHLSGALVCDDAALVADGADTHQQEHDDNLCV